MPPRAAGKLRIYKAFDPPAEHQCSERSSRALTQPDTSGQHSQHSEHCSPETVQEAAAAGRISYRSAHRPGQPGDSAGGPTPRVELPRISTRARPAQRQYVRFTTAGQIPTWSAQARPTWNGTACSVDSLDDTQTRLAEGASLSSARDHHCRSGFLRGQQTRPAAQSCIVITRAASPAHRLDQQRELHCPQPETVRGIHHCRSNFLRGQRTGQADSTEQHCLQHTQPRRHTG